MKISADSDRDTKRAKRIVIEAETEVEEAVLFAKFLDLQAEPPALQPWLIDVLHRMELAGDGTPVYDIAEALNLPVTNCNNRVAQLAKLNLVKRKSNATGTGGRSFLYWLNLRDKNEEKALRAI
jgi:hypothetical protein